MSAEQRVKALSPYELQLAEAWRAHLAPRDRRAPTVVSTFAGAGGSSLGYSIAGFRELLAVEHDAHAAATFRMNFADVPVVEGDIEQLTVATVKKRTGLGRGELVILDGSPPCQGFSRIGNRQFTDTRNQLFLEFVRLLDGLRPRAFVVENVPGLVVGKMRLIFADMLRELKAVGYHVTAKILDAQFYGVPQERRRVIFLGVRTDVASGPLIHPGPHATPIAAQNAVRGVPSSPWTPLSPVNQRIWRHARPGQRGSDLQLSWSKAKTTSHFSHIRMSPYRPAPTLTKEGSWNFMHWSEPRSLSLGEAKRLASFPDPFRFAEGTFAEQFARIGNCVPPLFMAAIARALRAQLEALTATSSRRRGNPMNTGARARAG